MKRHPPRSLSKYASAPLPCGMCGKAVFGGLLFGGKPANQAMSPVGDGVIHWDRKLCQALKKVEDKDLEPTIVHKAPERSVADLAGRDDIHPESDVGLDRRGDVGR